MQPEWLQGISMLGYGATIAVEIGVPIPIHSDEILKLDLTIADGKVNPLSARMKVSFKYGK